MKTINFKGINEFGSGGMDTKIEAAKICQLSGCNMIISNGLFLNPLDRILKKNKLPQNTISFVGRDASASPATGSMSTHNHEQKNLIKKTLNLKT